jgi:hypothetical protein
VYITYEEFINYTISDVFLDESGKYRVRVIISEYETMFFKFDHYPTQDEVNDITINYLKSLLNRDITER